MILTTQHYHLSSKFSIDWRNKIDICFRHLIFEYLPNKEISSPCSGLTNKDQEENSSVSGSSVIDKLLGRLPVYPSSPSASPPSSNGLEFFDLLLAQKSKDSSDTDPLTSDRTSLNIIDRLNEAIRQANCINESSPTTNADHRIAVQA